MRNLKIVSLNWKGEQLYIRLIELMKNGLFLFATMKQGFDVYL